MEIKKEKGSLIHERFKRIKRNRSATRNCETRFRQPFIVTYAFRNDGGRRRISSTELSEAVKSIAQQFVVTSHTLEL